MRCKFCGSASIHPDKQHKTFSAGKAVAGAVTFGVIGAAAGFIGKDQKGYRCGACGSFMDTAMDYSTELAIDSAIRDAESGRSTSMYNYYKQQYTNIHANVSVAPQSTVERIVEVAVPQNITVSGVEESTTLKHTYRCNVWMPGCPVIVESIIIKTQNNKDYLSLVLLNQSKEAIRSAYFDAVVYDDTGDEVGSCKCVYQNLNVEPGKRFPVEQEFDLNTDIAYRVSLKCEKIALSNDEVWRWNDEQAEYTLFAQETLTEGNFPRLKYVWDNLEHGGIKNPPNQLFMPVIHDAFWQCICGHPVSKTETSCFYCGAESEKLRTLLSQQYLQEIQIDAVKKRAAARAEKTIALYEQAYNKQFETSYNKAVELDNTNTVESVEEAIVLYATIPDWKDAAARKEACEKKLVELKEKAEQERIAAEKKAEEERIAAEKRAEEERIAAEEKAKKMKKMMTILIPVVVVIIVLLIVVSTVIVPGNKYKQAMSLVASHQYAEAYTILEDLGDYKDAPEQIKKAQLAEVQYLFDNGQLDEAETLAESLGDYAGASELLTAINDAQAANALEEKYQRAITYISEGEYDMAVRLLEDVLESTDMQGYKDSQSLLEDALIGVVQTAKIGEVVEFGSNEAGEKYEWLVANAPKATEADEKVLVLKRYLEEYPVAFQQAASAETPAEGEDAAGQEAQATAGDADSSVATPSAITWENSSLRQWLNNDFFNMTFSEKEAAVIKTHTYNNYVTDSLTMKEQNELPATEDKVAVLSQAEVKEYGLQVYSWARNTCQDSTGSVRPIHINGTSGKSANAVTPNYVTPVIWIEAK